MKAKEFVCLNHLGRLKGMEKVGISLSEVWVWDYSYQKRSLSCMMVKSGQNQKVEIKVAPFTLVYL